MSGTENKNPSPETQKQINEGVNFVYDWLTERYAAGKMTKEEYDSATDKLRNTKILPTERGTDRLIDAYENGELALSDRLIQQGVTTEHLKHGLLAQSSHVDDLRGLSTYWSNYPVVLINIDKINADSHNRADVSSVVAHELTHCIGLKETSEKAIEQALYGRAEKTSEHVENQPFEAQNISVQIIPDSGTERYVHNENKGRIADSGQKPDGLELNEGVSYSPYLDNSKEIYARIMQMRHDMKLNPRKIYLPEDVEELRKDLLKKNMNGQQTGAEKDTYNRIFDRYSNEQISHFLNDTAQVEHAFGNEQNYMADTKQIMANDAANCNEVLAALEKSLSGAYTNGTKTEENQQDNKTEKSQINVAAMMKAQREYG